MTHLLLTFWKWRLGVWLVRRCYARDAVVKQVCSQRISQLKKKILRLSPLPATPLSVAESALKDAEARRFKSMLPHGPAGSDLPGGCNA